MKTESALWRTQAHHEELSNKQDICLQSVHDSQSVREPLQMRTASFSLFLGHKKETSLFKISSLSAFPAHNRQAICLACAFLTNQNHLTHIPPLSILHLRTATVFFQPLFHCPSTNTPSSHPVCEYTSQ